MARNVSRITLSKEAFEAMWATFSEEAKIEFSNGVAQSMASHHMKALVDEDALKAHMAQLEKDIALNLERTIRGPATNYMSGYVSRRTFEPSPAFKKSYELMRKDVEEDVKVYLDNLAVEISETFAERQRDLRDSVLARIEQVYSDDKLDRFMAERLGERIDKAAEAILLKIANLAKES